MVGKAAGETAIDRLSVHVNRKSDAPRARKCGAYRLIVFIDAVSNKPGAEFRRLIAKRRINPSQEFAFHPHRYVPIGSARCANGISVVLFLRGTDAQLTFDLPLRVLAAALSVSCFAETFSLRCGLASTGSCRLYKSVALACACMLSCHSAAFPDRNRTRNGEAENQHLNSM